MIIACILIYILIVIFFLSLFRAAASADRVWEKGPAAKRPAGSGARWRFSVTPFRQPRMKRSSGRKEP